MTVEKVRRVQSIRKWLEKAEKSFSSNKEISGELNLIMAQAEMQRLKETDKTGERRKAWCFRVAALAAAFLVVSGAALFRETGTTAELPPVTAATMQLSGRNETKKTENTAPSVTAAAAKETPAADMSVTHAEQSRAVPVSAEVREVRAQPVLSEQEIQSVVGEAGRALRGQS